VEDLSASLAYDITILDANGAVFEPDEHGSAVTVTIMPGDEENNSLLTAYHQGEDGSTTDLGTGTVKDGEISYEADHFSVIIVGTKVQEAPKGAITMKPEKTEVSKGETFQVDVMISAAELESAVYRVDLPLGATYAPADGPVLRADGESGESA
jgi:hypothetical protein